MKIVTKEQKALAVAIGTSQGVQMASKRDDLELTKLLEFVAIHLLSMRLSSASDEQGRVPDLMINSVLNRVGAQVRDNLVRAAKRRQPPRMH